MLSEFDLLSPETLSEALQFMAQKAPDVSPVAGGTNLIVDLRSGKHNRPYLVNIEALEELKGLRLINNKIQIGACTKINELINSQIIKENAQVLIDAAKTFANPLIRNRATIGGNLVDASPASDTAPPLLVLDAELELQSVNGSRVISIEDFFIHVRKTTLKPGEILTSISFPIPEPTTHFAYYKLGLRKADAISVVSLAVRIGFDSKGKCTKARIALGSVAPKPLRVLESENFLTGKLLSEDVIQKAASIAASSSTPITDLRASAGYRTKMVETLVRRLLTEIVTSKKDRSQA